MSLTWRFPVKARDFARVLLATATAVVATISVLRADPSHAQAWPSQPIRMIIPSTPGGGTDFIGRLLSTKLADMNGWTLVPTNRPGAGTALGLGEAAKA